MQTMLFAAGKGTRLKPLTDIIPKALVPIADKPLLQIVTERLAAAGADSVVVNVHHHAAQMFNFIKLLRLALPQVTIQVSDESDELLETGGAIKKAIPLFRRSEPILIHNCDILSDLDLKGFYNESQECDAEALLLVSERTTQRYLVFDDDMRLVGWTNIQTGEVRSPYKELAAFNGRKDMDWRKEGLRLYAFAGIHCFSPELFPLMKEWPDRFPIMDFYLHHLAEHKIKGRLAENLHLLDVGKLDTLASADNFLKTYVC